MRLFEQDVNIFSPFVLLTTKKTSTVLIQRLKNQHYFLRVIIADMKVGKNSNRQNGGAADQIQFDDDGRGYRYDRGITGELAGVRRR